MNAQVTRQLADAEGGGIHHPGPRQYGGDGQRFGQDGCVAHLGAFDQRVQQHAAYQGIDLGLGEVALQQKATTCALDKGVGGILVGQQAVFMTHTRFLAVSGPGGDFIFPKYEPSIPAPFGAKRFDFC